MRRDSAEQREGRCVAIVNNQDQAEDWWIKTSTWETWAPIEAANDGSAHVRFISDRTGEEFGELNFTSVENAIGALRRNEFRRYREDKVIQDLWHPPTPPFPRIERPNLLCSIFWTDVLVSETSILQKISAMLKKYEPGFELEGAFVPGVRGRADPNFRAANEERLRLLGLSPERVFLAESFAEGRYQESDDGAEADPRINWRVTARHGAYYIHIMALNQGLSRFACCFQTANEVKERLASEYGCQGSGYETGTLAEIDNVLDDLYPKIKHWDEQRRQQDRIDQAVDRAVAEEREKWVKRSEEEKTKRRQVGYLIAFAAVVLAFGFIINAINKHFHDVPGDVFFTGLGAGIAAFIGALLYLWGVVSFGLKVGLLKDGKPTPLLMPSAGIVFVVLWIALAYAAFRGLI
jgi:hypothetical protein